MGETRRSFDPEFRAGAVRIVRETGRSIASVAKDLGINAGTLANWMQMDRLAREQSATGELSESEREELARLRHHKGIAASLKLGQTPARRHPFILTVLKRSVVLWVREATGR